MALRHAREQRLAGAGDLQHQRLDDPARVRRRALHARRPRGRRRVDQGLPHPARRLLPGRRSTSPRSAAPSTATRSPRSSTTCGRCPTRSPACSPTWSRCASWRASSRDATSVLFLGRHVGYPVALEGALKLKELAYMHAEGFAAGELKHGPIALIEDGVPVIAVGAVTARARACCTTRSCRTSRRSARAVRAPSSSPRRATTRSCPTPTTVIRIPAGADPAAAAAVDRARCRCSPARWRRRGATTSTSRATWPSRVTVE